MNEKNEHKVSIATLARTVALAVTLVNVILTGVGKNPIPYSETEVFGAVSDTALVISTLWAWWKNNSFTKNAIKADNYLKELRAVTNDAEERDF